MENSLVLRLRLTPYRFAPPEQSRILPFWRILDCSIRNETRMRSFYEPMTVGALGSAAYAGHDAGRRLEAPALLFEGAPGHSDRPLALAGSSEVGQQAIA